MSKFSPYSSYLPPTFIEKLTIAMIGFFAFLQVYSVQAILPVLVEQLHANEIQAGLAVGATVIGIALLSPFIGMLSDSFGRKSFIVIALLFLAIPTAMIGFSADMQQLIFWRFLQGLSIPGITVVLIAYISEEYQKHIAAMMSLYVSGTVLGGFSGRFFAGYLQEWIGWQTGYLVMAIFTLLGAMWTIKMLPSSKNFQLSGNISTSLQILINHTKNPHVISSCLLGSCVLFSLVGCFTFINLHLADVPYQLSTSSLANIFSIYLIGMAITPLTAKLIKHLGMINTIILAVSLCIFGMLITLMTPLVWVIVGLTLMSSGVFVAQSSTISYIASHVQEGRSLASGLYYLCYYGGGGLGAWACGIAYTQGKWVYTVILIILFQLLALLVAWVFMKKTSSN